ncbi:hypothetical protein D9758_011741 [Tetrapyrgos nigripes]|uniref:Uncharacterized protein n=1 Tax=Tetrapyrgos nigripes TaxID=182062 RepID=A0A8H5GD15_9AGAR|nr:hypothetical protein D9758_011741 [Tetrapyrgos nigripes]
MPSIDPHDPFSELLQPPKHETPSEKASRERREADAKEVSDRIDEELRQERARLKKERDIVKVLLLGQSESGKSTTLKNFRLTYSRSEWDAEKTSWRTVIQLNLIRSINTILDTLQAEIDGDPIGRGGTAAVRQPTAPSASPKNRTKGLLSDFDEADTDPRRPKSSHSQMTFNEDSPTHFGGNSKPKSDELTHQLRTQVTQLRLRLSPLRQVEMDLRRQLGAGTEEVTEAALARGILPSNGYQTETDADAVVGRRDHDTTTELNNDAARAVTGERESRARRVRGPGDEVFVRGWRWREMMRMAQAGSNVYNGLDLLNGGTARNSHAEDATEVIWRLKSDMKLLWTDEQVREILRRRDVVLENNGGFFLDDIDRIATRSYEPSDDDVVRARLRTLGVQEHRVVFESLGK